MITLVTSKERNLSRLWDSSVKKKDALIELNGIIHEVMRLESVGVR